MRKGFLAIFFVVVAFGSDKQADTTTETVVAHDEDIIPLHSSVRETTLIVLPASEKAMGVFCGDKTYWNVDVIPGAERYIAVKPSKAGISTDIHIVTDHNNSYTFQAVEGANGSVALKLFVKPADASSLEKPPAFVSASEVAGLKQQLADTQAALKKVQDTSAAQVKAKSEQARADYPDTMQFSYNFKKDKPPFNVEAVWHDDKFTYIRAHPQEAPALYEVKDGKPNLIQFELRPDGLYFVPKILDRAYLQIGRQRLDIWK
ncbi:MAG: TrbG/VirB9 family P-type conjugative transfer protein [Bryobacteraceae bacterium]